MNLKDFDTLAEAQAYNYNQERMVSPDMMLSMLSIHDSVLPLQNAAQSNNKAAGFLLALTGSVQEFNLMNSHPIGQLQQANLDQFVTDGIVTSEFRDAAIAYANINPVYPFANSTQINFNNAKGIFTEKKVTDYAAGKNIIVTLNQAVEPCTITTWVKNEGFEDENFGKVAHIKSGVTKYKIRCDNKKSDGDLYVRVPFADVDFSEEVV